MKNIKTLALYTAVVLMAILVVSGVVYSYSGGTPKVVVEGDFIEAVQPEMNLGAFPGGDMYDNIRLYGSLTHGLPMWGFATSATSWTLTQKQLDNYGGIDIMSNTGNYTLTMPATSTMLQILPAEGMSRKWLIHNATSSTATFTLATGAGMDLVSVTTNDDIIDKGEWMEVECQRILYRAADNTNVMCILTELENSD